MTQTAAEIVVGANGSLNVAPLATAAPIDPVTPYGTGWIELGFANESGVKLHDAKTLAEVKSWQAFYPTRRIVTAKEFTVAAALQQWNKTSVPLAFGGGAVTAPIAGATATVSNKALASNVATLTTAAPHGFAVGQRVVVAGVDATFDGSYTITVVGSATTFSYAKTATNVSSTAATGSATVGAVYRYAPPPPSVIDERELGIDWVDGSYHYRLIVVKCMITSAVDAELVKSKEAELPLTFGLTVGDTGDPWYLMTDNPALNPA